mmetsp:Transcript_28046/g.87048  ORF Transcript_28046/g.87048 Transcript_28046/m.87048 type:complete len:400 (-) Transcript_28046:89-1288(-)
MRSGRARTASPRAGSRRSRCLCRDRNRVASTPCRVDSHVRRTDDGRTYYVDTIKETTSWELPGCEAAPPGTIEASGNRKSLLIGINYPGSSAELRGCINDVSRMKELIVSRGFPDGSDKMRVLTDDGCNDGDPTCEAIVEGIAWLVEGAETGDCLFFHYSGHGGQMRDTDCAEDDGFDETLIPCDYQSAGQIPDDLLWKELVNKVPEGVRLTAIMDCCHSGTGLDLPFKFQMGRGWSVDDDPGFSPGDVQMFSGCMDSQTSADCVAGGVAGGAMTNAFLAVLSAHDDGDLQYHDLMDALHTELKRKRMSQKPQLSSSQKFELADRAFSLSDGVLGNGNAHLGRPPRQPGFKKRPNTAGAAPMGGLPIEEFLAVMNGGDGGDALVGKLLQLGISLASNSF